MAEISNYGAAHVRQIDGDWTKPDLKGWKACLPEHSIMPVQQFTYTTRKNSTDGAMIIDAMNLLYPSSFASFCIVSSNRDFTRCAARICDQGATVSGFGERKTHNALIAACDQPTYFDVLNVEEEPEESPLVVAPQAPRHGVMPPVFVPRQQIPRPLDQPALNGLIMAVSKAKNYGDDWVNLAEAGGYLNKLSPNLNARNYGRERLRDFVEASGIVETKLKNMGDKPPIALVRLKDRVLFGRFLVAVSYVPSDFWNRESVKSAVLARYLYTSMHPFAPIN